jgi:hypothetical protein
VSYATYELLKAEWVAKNPESTHIEYQKAMQKIARKCGI